LTASYTDCIHMFPWPVGLLIPHSVPTMPILRLS